MIFKTFDSDIDNMSSRWGMFGKSFSDIGDTITTKWKQVTDYVAVTNDATISGMMSAWKGTSPVQFLSDDSVVNVLNDYNKALDKGAEATAKFFEAGTDNDFMNGWLKQLKGAPATMDDYKAAVAKAELAQNGLTASMVASKVAALALNVAVSMGVSIAISALIKLVDNLVHANEKAIEKAEELRDKYNDFKETNASNVKTLNDLKDEFEELSDGVSQYGDNISLTTEQYARYQEIVQQIVGMSPSLAEGYDTENGYIADKNGLLERAIELQEIEYRNELRKITNLDNLKTSMSGYIAEYKEALNGGYVTSEGNIIGTTIDTDFKNSLWEVFNTNNRDNYDGQSMARDIMESLGVKDIDKEIEKYINEYGYWQDSDFWNDYCDKIVSNLDVVTNSLTAEEVGLDDTIFDQNIEKLESYAEQYSDMKDSVKSANESIQTDLGHIAEYADGYSDLSKEQQKFVTDYLKGFDISDITSENSMGILEYDEDKMASVKNQIKKFVEELSHDDSTKQALTDLYAPPSDNETIEEYKNRIDSALEVIRKYCEANGIEIPVGISDVEDSTTDLEDSYKQTITNAQEKFDTKMSEDQLSAVEYYNQATESAEKYRSSLDDIYKSYNGISNVDRDIIYWDDENLEKYKSFIESWGESAEDLKGTWSTVLGSSENIDGVEVAFTAMLQTDHGLVPLDQDTFWDYFDTIFNQSWNEDGTFNADKFIKLDSEGADMMINGQMEHVANMIAAAEGQYMNGVKLTADDVIAIGSPGYDENGKDLLPGNNSKYKGNSMHEVQEWALENRYALAQLDEQAKKSNTTVNQLIADTEKFGDNTDWESWFAENVHTQEEIDKWREIAQNCNDATEAKKKYLKADTSKEPPVFSDIFSLKDTNDTLTTLGKISESIDTIQNAYNTLNSAIDEYNNSGSISIDTLQSIVALGDDWYDYLLDENGALKLDKESLQALTLSRLADMKAQIQQNMIDSVKKINDDASAKEYLTSTNYKTADSIEAVTDAMIDQALAEKRLLVDSGDLSQENYDLIEKKLRGDIEKSNLLVSNISLDDISLSGGSSSSKSNSKSNSKDSIDIIDFAEEKLNHLNTLIDDTQKHIEQLEGSANKNALVDSLVDINKSKMNTLEQVSDLYTRMANEYLAKIPEQYKGLAKEGGLEIDKFIGDGNSEVTDAIKDYQTWANKVDDINSQLIELKQTLKDLEVDKFNNIKDDFDSMYSILDKNKSKIKDVVSLLETQEQNVGQGFYEELITETKSQIQILKEERDTLTSQMTSALRNGIEYGSNEWKDMYDALQDVDSSIISCENDLKDFQRSINELHWNTLEKIKDQFSSISSELDNLNSLLEKDTVTSNGKFTSEAITQIGLLAQKYELAKNEVSQYNKEIKYLENLYKNGKISINEYTDKLNELRDSQFSSISTAEEAKKAILDLAEARVNEAIDAIDEETDAYEELINKQKDSLQAEKDLYEYKKNIAQKEKEISALKRKINAMMGSDDASTIAEREKLEAELAEAVNDLEDYKYDHSVEVRSDALDKELEDYKDAQDKRTEALKDSLKNEEEVLNKAISEAKSRANEISNTLLTLERKQGITIASCIITPWRTGSSAIAGYNQALNSSTSNFTAKLNGIKTNIQSVQTQANNMASTIMSAFNISNNSGVYEAISKVRQNLYNTSVESIHLKQWISSALNSTYGNGAVNSINNVRDAANKAGSSVNGLRYEINQLSKSIPDLTTNMTAFATGAYAASSYKDLLDMIKRNEAKLSAQSGQGNLPSAGINKYLPFPMFAEGGVVNGKSNKLAQSFGEDVTIFAKKGERVLSLEQTKSFDKLVSNLPEITPKLEDFVKTFKLPQNNFTKVGSSTPIINIDAGITVQGNIDKNFAKEFENMQNQLTKNVTGKIATSLEKLGMQKNNCRPL